MEVKDQLKNVAFGGDWSERILTRHEIDELIRTLSHAAETTVDEDARTEAVFMALETVEIMSPKGVELAAGFRAALDIQDQRLRVQQVRRYLWRLEIIGGRARDHRVFGLRLS